MSRVELRAARATRRSRLALIGAVVVAALILVAWFPAGALFRQHSNLTGATAQLHQLQQQDRALAQERKNLSNSAEISRLAREQYQLVSPGQSAYEVLPPSGPASTGTPYSGDPGLTSPTAPSATTELPPGTASSHSGPATHSTSSQPGTLERMLHALEFWR